MKFLKKLLFTLTCFFVNTYSFLTPLINTDELPIVVITCSYNNALWVEKNLDSIFMQNYYNFRLIYIDDASTDGTADLVQKYIDEHNLQDRVTLIRKSFRGRKMKNIYNAYRSCSDFEIIVQVDGDDWLAHENVLSTINNEYLNNDIWMTYGTHKNIPYNMGCSAHEIPDLIINNRHFRKIFPYMPLRTFYAWLFKQIKLEDVISSHTYEIPQYRGTFYPSCDDGVIMWAMAEMANKRFKFIPKILYVANRENPILSLKIDNKLLQATSKDVRKKIPLYPAFEKPIYIDENHLTSLRTTGIFYSQNEPEKLKNILDKIHTQIKDIEQIIVLYTSDDNEHNYDFLKSMYPTVTFINISKINLENFLNTLENSSCSYLLMFDDTANLDQEINCNKRIQELEKTSAYGFYCNITDTLMQEKNIPHEHIIDNMYVWKLGCDDKKYIKPHNFDLTIYHKNTILTELRKVKQLTIKECLHQWANSVINPKKVGLFYGHYKN